MEIPKIIENRTLNLLFGYMLIAVFSIAVDVSVYWFLVSFAGIYYLFASAFTYTTGKTIIYFLNKKYNFKDTQEVKKQFPIFFLIALSGLALTQLFLWILVDIVDMGYLDSRIIVLMVVGVWNFTWHKNFTFKEERYPINWRLVSFYIWEQKFVHSIYTRTKKLINKKS